MAPSPPAPLPQGEGSTPACDTLPGWPHRSGGWLKATYGCAPALRSPAGAGGGGYQRSMRGKVGRRAPSPQPLSRRARGAHQGATPWRAGRNTQAAGSSLPTAAHHHCTLLRGREVADINDLCGVRLAASRPHPRPLSRRARGAHQRAIPCRVGRSVAPTHHATHGCAPSFPSPPGRGARGEGLRPTFARQ